MQISAKVKQIVIVQSFVCPKCSVLIDVFPPILSEVIFHGCVMRCPNCEANFRIDFTLLDRDAQQRNEAERAGADKTNNMELCGNCGTPRFIHGAVVEACPKCGDDETDLAMRGELP